MRFLKTSFVLRLRLSKLSKKSVEFKSVQDIETGAL